MGMRLNDNLPEGVYSLSFVKIRNKWMIFVIMLIAKGGLMASVNSSFVNI